MCGMRAFDKNTWACGCGWRGPYPRPNKKKLRKLAEKIRKEAHGRH